MNPTKEKLVRDLAAQAGLVLRNVRLIEDLRASRQPARRRAGRGAPRDRAEHPRRRAAAARRAGRCKLRLARTGSWNATRRRRASMLSRAAGPATEALEDLRDLARGIYPPLLADKGLAGRARAQAGSRRCP